MTELRTFFVSVIPENTPPGTVSGHIGTVIAPSVKEAAGMYILQTRSPIPMALGGTVDLRVQEEGKPDFDRVTCWTDAEGLQVKVYGRETDSVSEAIDNMMEPLTPSASEVSEEGKMTISQPHPWTVFRVYCDDDILGPTLVLAMSFGEALGKAEERGLHVKSIARVDFEGFVEKVSDF